MGALVFAFLFTTVTGALGGAVVGRVSVVGGSTWLHAVACPPSGSCIAVGYRGNILKRSHHPVVVVPISRGGIPGRAVSVPGSDRAFDAATIACPDADFCLTAVNATGDAPSEILPIRNGRPGRPEPTHTFLQTISCGSPTVCWAFGGTPGPRGAGRVLRIVNGHPDTLYRYSTLPRLVGGVCISDTTCLVGAGKKIVQINNGSLGPAVPILPGIIECPTATDCVSAGPREIQTVRAGQPVHTALQPARMFTSAFACASIRLCYEFFPTRGGNPDKAGAGLYNWVARFNGQRFTARTSVEPFITGATCLSNTCIGVGTEGTGPAQRILAGVVYGFH